MQLNFCFLFEPLAKIKYPINPETKDPAVRIPILAESKYSGLDAPTIKNGDTKHRSHIIDNCKGSKENFDGLR